MRNRHVHERTTSNDRLALRLLGLEIGQIQALAEVEREEGGDRYGDQSDQGDFESAYEY